PAVGDADPRRVTARADDELLLEVATVAVEPEVNAVPDSAIHHLPVRADAGPPPGGVIPEVVVVRGGEGPSSLDDRPRPGSEAFLGDDEPFLNDRLAARSEFSWRSSRSARLLHHPT